MSFKEDSFSKSDDEIVNMAVESMKYLIELTKDFDGNVTYQYSAESFSQTDLTLLLKICNAVIDVVKPTVEKKDDNKLTKYPRGL